MKVLRISFLSLRQSHLVHRFLLPVALGRTCLNYVMAMYGTNVKIHELYTAACGLYIGWLTIRYYGFFLFQGVFSEQETFTKDPRYPHRIFDVFLLLCVNERDLSASEGNVCGIKNGMCQLIELLISKHLLEVFL